MPRRTNDFQRLLYLIHRALAEECEVEESVELTDRISGKKREVDIVIRTGGGPHSIIIGVECRGRGRPASIEWVEQQWAKHQNLTDKLILVSESGFSRDAEAEAQSRGIEAYAMKEVLRDTESRMRRVAAIRFSKLKTQVRYAKLAVDRPIPLPLDCAIFDRSGIRIGTADEVWEWFYQSAEVQAVLNRTASEAGCDVEVVVSFAQGAHAFAVTGEKVSVSRLRLGLTAIKLVGAEMGLKQSTFAGHAIAHGTDSSIANSIKSRMYR